MALTSGARFGPYEVLSPLGSGGMGEVYRARDTRLDRDVAMKVLPEAFVADPERVARFQREAKTLASLNHTNIAIIHGLEQAGGVHALVMELVEGEDLSQRIARGAIPLDEALPIAKQIAEALEAAHEQGIIHRDLKPANIKVRPDGTVKVLDFGLAKAVEGAGEAGGAGRPGRESLTQSPTLTTPAMTQAGMILGTAAYMSPEQARGTPVDKRADLWSFGIVLYEMLTGQRLFDGPTVSDTLALILTRDPDWTRLPGDTPPSVRRLLQRCLERDRRRRLPDAADIRIEIDDAKVPTAPGVVRSARPLGWMLATATLAILAIAALSAFLFTRFGATTSGAPAVRFEIALPDELAFRRPGIGGLPSFAMSPDGQTIAFVAWNGTTTQLWLRRIDEAEIRPIAGTDGAANLTWSPESSSLAFWGGSPSQGGPPTQIKIAKLGGAVRVLGEPPPSLRGTLGGGANWGSGTILFGNTRAEGAGLVGVDVVSGRFSIVTRCEKPCEGHVEPVFLPDGRRFLYSALGTPSGLFLGSLDTPEAPRQVLRDFGKVALSSNYLFAMGSDGPPLLAYPFDSGRGTVLGEPIVVTDEIAWSSQNRRGAFSSAINGTLVTSGSGGQRILPKVQLTWVTRGGTPGNAVGEAAPLVTMGISHDGHRVVYARRDTAAGLTNLSVTDLDRGTTTRLTSSKTDTDGTWSKDDSRIAFASARDDHKRIYVIPSAGGVEAPFPMGADVSGIDDWAPNDSAILYHMDGSRELWAQPLEGTAKPILVAKPSSGRVDQAAFSPDSQWVAFASEESGRSEIHVAPFPPTGEHWPVSVSGGVQPKWRSDGRELFFLAPDGTMMAVNVGLPALPHGGASRPAQARPDFSAPHVLFKTGVVPVFGTDQYDTTDGQRFLIMMPLEEKAIPARETMAVWMNWMAAIQKRSVN